MKNMRLVAVLAFFLLFSNNYSLGANYLRSTLTAALAAYNRKIRINSQFAKNTAFIEEALKLYRDVTAEKRSSCISDRSFKEVCSYYRYKLEKEEQGILDGLSDPLGELEGDFLQVRKYVQGEIDKQGYQNNYLDARKALCKMVGSDKAMKLVIEDDCNHLGGQAFGYGVGYSPCFNELYKKSFEIFYPDKAAFYESFEQVILHEGTHILMKDSEKGWALALYSARRYDIDGISDIELIREVNEHLSKNSWVLDADELMHGKIAEGLIKADLEDVDSPFSKYKELCEKRADIYSILSSRNPIFSACLRMVSTPGWPYMSKEALEEVRDDILATGFKDADESEFLKERKMGDWIRRSLGLKA